jgi:hypothetical protein
MYLSCSGVQIQCSSIFIGRLLKTSIKFEKTFDPVSTGLNIQNSYRMGLGVLGYFGGWGKLTFCGTPWSVVSYDSIPLIITCPPIRNVPCAVWPDAELQDYTAPLGSGYSAICHAGPMRIGPNVIGDVMWSGAYWIIRGHNTDIVSFLTMIIPSMAHCHCHAFPPIKHQIFYHPHLPHHTSTHLYQGMANI